MSLVPATGVHEIGLWRRRIGHLPLQTVRRGQIRQQVSTQNAHNGVLLDTYQPRGRRELPFRWGQHRLPLRESAAPAEDNRLGVPERRHLPLGHRRRTIRFPAAAAGRYASSAERLARVRSCQVRGEAGSYRSCRQRALRVEPSKARTRRSLVTAGRKPGGGAKPCPAFPIPDASSHRQVSTKSASRAVELDTSPSKHRISAGNANRCPRRTRTMAFRWTPVNRLVTADGLNEGRWANLTFVIDSLEHNAQHSRHAFVLLHLICLSQ